MYIQLLSIRIAHGTQPTQSWISLLYPRQKVNILRRSLLVDASQHQMTCNSLLHPFNLVMLIGLRCAQLTLFFGPPLLHYLLKSESFYQELSLALKRSSGAFIKLGQWAATRPDILPSELCCQLNELHSNAPSHHIEHSKATIAKYPELKDLMIDGEPLLGSGTIGQVHLGRWKGRFVAVKVLHPQIEEQIQVDLLILNVLLQAFRPILDLRGELKVFRKMLLEQLDLRFEGCTLLRFRRNFQYSRSVHFPRVLFCRSDVLIESVGHGIPMTLFIEKVNNEQLRKQVAEIGVSAFLKMLLWDNFVHADLHPGNMLVHISCDGQVLSVDEVNDRTKQHCSLEVAVVFLDTGLVTELSGRDHDNFVALFKALIVDGDGGEAGRLVITRTPQPLIINPNGFCDKIDKIIHPVLQSRFKLDRQVAFAPLLMKAMQAVREHQVKLEPAFTNLAWSVVCVEGVGRQLAPDLHMQPILVKAALQFLVATAARKLSYDRIQTNS